MSCPRMMRWVLWRDRLVASKEWGMGVCREDMKRGVSVLICLMVFVVNQRALHGFSAVVVNEEDFMTHLM
jgi:hypothetical protein